MTLTLGRESAGDGGGATDRAGENAGVDPGGGGKTTKERPLCEANESC